MLSSVCCVAVDSAVIVSFIDLIVMFALLLAMEFSLIEMSYLLSPDTSNFLSSPTFMTACCGVDDTFIVAVVAVSSIMPI